MAEWGGGFRGGDRGSAIGGAGPRGAVALAPAGLRGSLRPLPGPGETLVRRGGGSSASGNAGLGHGLSLRKAETSASPALL